MTEATPSHLFSILKHLLFYDAPPWAGGFFSLLFLPYQCLLTISLTFISWLVVDLACSSSFIEMYLMVSV